MAVILLTVASFHKSTKWQTTYIESRKTTHTESLHSGTYIPLRDKQRVQELKRHLHEVANTLKEVRIRYYMYDDPNITLTGNTNVARTLRKRSPKLSVFKYEEKNDKQMIRALTNSSLRTFNASEAELFVPPIPMTSIFMATKSDFHTPMRALLEHTIFKRHQGNNHLLISTCFALHRYYNKGLTAMKRYYKRIFNMTIVQSWDPVGVHNDNNTNWGDYQGLRKQESLSRRSVSVGLGSGNHDIPLTLASLERFHSSTNFIFYHSRQQPYFNNATMFRHAPITNITLENFPKSSIGWDISAGEWLSEFNSSQFCLNIRGDSPHSKSLWRTMRVGCIPVIVSKHLPVYAPMFKSTINMSEYAVILDEEEMLTNTTETLLKLREMTTEEIELKIMHLAFAQRVIFTDHPQSLFVPALLKEAVMAEEAIK